MSVWDYLRKLSADLKARDIPAALGDALQIFVLFFGFNPLLQLPTPNPERAGTMSVDITACDESASAVDEFIRTHEGKHGASKFGDGVLLGKIFEMLMPLILKLIGGGALGKPA